MKRPILWILLCLAVIVCTVTVILSNNAEDPERTEPATTRPIVTQQEKPSPSVHRTAISASLSIKIVEAGMPAKAKLVWANAATPLRLMETVTNRTPDRVKDPDGLHRADANTDFLLEIPAGGWTWLRARSAKNPLAFRFVRVPPFHGKQELEVDLTPGNNTIHVVVYAHDFTKTQNRSPVELHWTSLIRPDQSSVTRLETDDSGYLRFDKILAGTVTLTAPGARRSDQPPQSISFVLTPNSLPNDHHCTLVATPTTRVVTLKLHVESIEGAGYGEKIFLRRLAGSGPRLTPQAGIMTPGINEISLRLPDGTFEVDALPLGQYSFQPRSFRVNENSTSFAVFAKHSRSTTMLSLKGISRRFLPIRVSPIRPEDLSSQDPGLLFIGPSHWTQTKMKVPSQMEPHRLVAFGRNCGFISKEKINLGSPNAEAKMIQATFIRLEWEGVRDLHGAVATFQGGDHAVARTLEPELVAVDGQGQPAWCCTVVMPRGEIEISIDDGEGRSLWSQHLNVDRHRYRLRIPVGS